MSRSPLSRAEIVWIGLLYAAISVAFCLPLFAHPAALGTGDWDQHLFYYAEVLKNAVEYAQAPFWSPWYCGGNVLWQNPQVALLSPAYPLTAVMPFAAAMKVNIVLHYWVGLVGMHLLLTRIAGLSFLPVVVYLASMFTLGGAYALHLAAGHSVFLPGFYLPLQLYFFIRSIEGRALRPALYAGALLALMIDNGGLHVVPLVLVAIGALALFASFMQRHWRPLLFALVVGVSGAAYAAPKLIPVALFVTSDRFWDARDTTDHPDRMTPEMIRRAYTDPSQTAATRVSGAQRHAWWEYGNYIGWPGALLIFTCLAWTLLFSRAPDRLRTNGFALTALVFLVLSAGEFSVVAPASALERLPIFSSFRIPSRYTIGFVLFGVLTVAAVMRAAAGALTATRTRAIATTAVCVLGVVQIAAVNRAHFRATFAQPPLDGGFRVLKGTGVLTRNVFIDPYAGNSPMLRALMRDQAVDWCYEGIRLTRGSDVNRPLVWSEDDVKLSSIVFTPNRVQFSAIGGREPSRVFLNQNYAAGWRSSAGPVLLDPQAGGRMYVQLARGQTGTYAFSFVPSGFYAGTIIWLLAIGASVALWRTELSWLPTHAGVASPATAALSVAARVERLSKPVILISMAAAIMTRLLVGYPPPPYPGALEAIAFVIAFALSSRLERATGIFVASMYAAPIAIRLWANAAQPYETVWMSLMVGAMMPRWPLGRWRLPPTWRVPLAGWGLATALTWPIVVAREFDFHPEPLTLLNRPVSAFPMLTSTAAALVASAALLSMFAVVWLDWLFAAFADDERRFRRLIVGPMLLGGVFACGIGAYQLFGDIGFLNEDWVFFGRAGATMRDANAFGIVAVLCSAGFAALFDRRRGRAWNASAAAGFVLTCIGMWASGSKTALIGELVVVAFVVSSLAPFERGARRLADRRTVTFAIAGVVVAAILLALAESGPARRLGRILPEASMHSVTAFARQMLWDRDGYGTAAVDMIRRHPWSGVGVGSFAVLAGDYRFSHLQTMLAPDNAQNWIRHQLAELGVLGSLGWIVWAVVIGAAIARGRRRDVSNARSMAVAGGLVAVVVVCQVGLPMSNPLVAITFWTFLFWYGLGRPLPDFDAAARDRAVPPWMWQVMAVVLVAFTATTVHAALTTLRVPMRARNAGWNYAYGLTRPAASPRGDFRWAQRSSVAVVPADTRVAKLTVWVDRRDIAANPVLARVWHDDRLVIDAVLRDNNPVSTYVAIDRDPQWLMVRTYFDRILPPNAREQGLAVQWQFLDAAPEGAPGSK